jgi:hypothetical protein
MSSEMGESSSVSLTLPVVLGWHQRHRRARALATTKTPGEGAVWESLRILERADWIASDGVKGVGQIGRHLCLLASQKLDRSTWQRSPVEGSQMLLQQRSKMRCLLRVVAELIEEGIRSPGGT